MRVPISILTLIVCMTSCNHEIEITGHWRPADAFKSEQEADSNLPRFRDLLLNSDSTFITVGLDQQLAQTEGWTNGNAQKGTWDYSGGFLSLQIEGTSRPVKFKILRLTKHEIIMETEFMKSIELRLIRIKN